MSLSVVARLPALGMTYHCPPAGENESVPSLAAPSGSGQRAGTPRDELLSALVGLFECDALRDGYRRDDNPDWDAPEVKVARALLARHGVFFA